MSIEVKGLKGVEDKLKKALADLEKAAGVGLYAVGNNMVAESMERTPVDVGNLRGSHYVTHPEKQGRITVEIGVGTTAESYAVEQHENLSQHAEGEAKFLEKGIAAVRGEVPRMIKEFASQVLKEGGSVPRVPNTGTPAAPQTGGARSGKVRRVWKKRVK